MCGPAILGVLGMGGGAAAGAGAAAAGAGAAAAGAGAFSGIGTALSVAGSLAQGIMGMQAAKAQEAAIEQQAETEKQLNAVQDQRTRKKYMAQISQQRAELAARGVDLSSPTSLALGQAAAQEMSFDSQAIRAQGSARQIELDAQAQAARWEGVSSFLKGTFSAADSVLKGSPDLWPGFDRGGATA